jgi:hypothetical protein
MIRLRERYVGAFPPRLVAMTPPVRLAHLRRHGNAVLVSIVDGEDIKVLIVSNPDDQRLRILGTDDRSRVHGALTTIGADVRLAPGEAANGRT